MKHELHYGTTRVELPAQEIFDSRTGVWKDLPTRYGFHKYIEEYSTPKKARARAIELKNDGYKIFGIKKKS